MHVDSVATDRVTATLIAIVALLTTSRAVVVTSDRETASVLLVVVVIIVAVPKMFRSVGGTCEVGLILFLSRGRASHGQAASVDGVRTGIILGGQVRVISCWLKSQEFVQAGDPAPTRQVCGPRLLADDCRYGTRKMWINGKGLIIVRFVCVGVFRGRGVQSANRPVLLTLLKKVGSRTRFRGEQVVEIKCVVGECSIGRKLCKREVSLRRQKNSSAYYY